MKEFNIRISEEAHKILKEEAKRSGNSMKNILEGLIKNSFEKNDKKDMKSRIKEIVKLEYLEITKPVKILKEIFKSWKEGTGHVDWARPAILFAGWLPVGSATEKKWIHFYEEEIETRADGEIFWNFFTNYSTPEEFAKKWIAEEDMKYYLSYCKNYK